MIATKSRSRHTAFQAAALAAPAFRIRDLRRGRPRQWYMSPFADDTVSPFDNMSVNHEFADTACPKDHRERRSCTGGSPIDGFGQSEAIGVIVMRTDRPVEASRSSRHVRDQMGAHPRCSAPLLQVLGAILSHPRSIAELVPARPSRIPPDAKGNLH